MTIFVPPRANLQEPSDDATDKPDPETRNAESKELLEEFAPKTKGDGKPERFVSEPLLVELDNEFALGVSCEFKAERGDWLDHFEINVSYVGKRLVNRAHLTSLTANPSTLVLDGETLSLDGKPYPFPCTYKVNSFRVGRDIVHTENYAIEVPMALLPRFLAAKRLGIAVGILEFEAPQGLLPELNRLAPVLAERYDSDMYEFKFDPVAVQQMEEARIRMQRQQAAQAAEDARLAAEKEAEEARRKAEQMERFAASKLRLADKWKSKGKMSLYRKYLQDILEDYPGTEAAQAVKKRLAE
ncbi:hypothetical protein [Maioricimonas sp. JC845]|uniref:hypothetical protein n=1 Tax=Maioricimonas sp. JC845 TaxID=3232138 RepID=UPI003457E28F